MTATSIPAARRRIKRLAVPAYTLPYPSKAMAVLAVAVIACLMALAGPPGTALASDGSPSSTLFAPLSTAEARPRTTRPISDDAMSQALAIASRYTNPQVTRNGTHSVVTFDDSITGRRHVYAIRPTEQPTSNRRSIPVAHSSYKTEWHWWGVKFRLNRNETRELVTEGTNAAILYGIGAFLGCTSCVIGAAIEGGWATLANSYYNRGNCIHLNFPYHTAGETRINRHNCRN
jgi:hypothetical protein